jgi:hypothetical protein
MIELPNVMNYAIIVYWKYEPTTLVGHSGRTWNLPHQIEVDWHHNNEEEYQGRSCYPSESRTRRPIANCLWPFEI